MKAAHSGVFDELAVVGKAFGNARRLQIVGLLAQGERTVESIAREFDLGMSTVSAHLQVLKLSNLARTRRDGTRIYYRLAGEDVSALYEAMLTVARHHSADVDRALEAYLGAPDSGEIAVVARADLAALITRGEVTVLDVRPSQEYAAGHIPGSRNVPLAQLADAVDSLRGAPVVAYCRGAYCVLAHDAVRLLTAAGISAQRLEDGMLEWRTHKHPVEVGT